MWNELFLRQTRPKNLVACLFILLVLLSLLYLWENDTFTGWTMTALISVDESPKDVFVKDATNQRQYRPKPSTPQKLHCQWPPRDIRELLNPQTGQYDLALRPCVDSSAYNNPASWYERYYQLLSILKPQAMGASTTQRAFQIEQELRINPSVHNYHLYPLLIDVEETVRAIRAGKPVKHMPMNNPGLVVLEAPTKFCATDKHDSHNKNITEHELIVLIKSCVRCTEQRQKARRTFMKPQLWNDFRIQFAFVIGVPPENFTGKFHFDGINIEHHSHGNEQNDSISARHNLIEEAATFGDLLIGNFADHYFSLPIKQLFTFRWISAFCREESKLFLFLDSDFAVVPRNMIRFVRSLPYQIRSAVSAGIAGQNQQVVRPASPGSAGRWDISESEFPWPSYAPYYAGAAYMLGLEAVTDFSVALSFLPPMRIDDANLGLVLFKLHRQAYGIRHFVHGVESAAHLDQVACVTSGYTDLYMDWSTGRIRNPLPESKTRSSSK